MWVLDCLIFSLHQRFAVFVLKQASLSSKEKSDSKSPAKGKEEKVGCIWDSFSRLSCKKVTCHIKFRNFYWFPQGRPESGRFGRRSDSRRSDERRPEDRRNSNRRDRRDTGDSSGSDRVRDDRSRKESGSDGSGRRDRRPESRRDSRPAREPEDKPKGREPLPKASDADKGGKSGREKEKEQIKTTSKANETEKNRKEEDSSVAGDAKPSREEEKGAAKDEKVRSEEETSRQRRLRNKVNKRQLADWQFDFQFSDF